MSYIRAFDQIEIGDALTYGGKVASLGEMTRAGIPVPDGFGIAAVASRKFHHIPFDESFQYQLHKAFAALGAKSVAVRSSAIAEDSSGASWAGQLESYLNVTHAGLEEAIRKCWQSIQSDRAADYAKDKNLAEGDLLVGVAVQAMVSADAAGVMFTANPVTGNREELMIEAAYGLGELVVQGTVTPDSYLIDAHAMQITRYQVNTKDQMMTSGDGGNKVTAVPPDRASAPVLNKVQVLRLAALGVKIAAHYRAPQDIEWCLAGGKFYVVQARPITTLK